MPDNVEITAGTGTDIATDLVGTAHYQRIKVDIGGDGLSVPIEGGQEAMAASIPVVIASDQSALPVTGTFWQATQPVSIATAPALVTGTAYIGSAPPDTVTVDVTLSMTAEAHHAGDVLAATQEVASVARANGKGVELVSMVVRDADDQTAAATTFFFFDADTALGTEGSAPDIDDTEIQALCGVVVVPASAFIDLGASKVANLGNLGLLMHPAAASTSLWLAAMTAGTPTPTTAGMTVTLQFVRY